MKSSEVNPTKVNVTKAADIPTAPTQANMISWKDEDSKTRVDNIYQNQKHKDPKRKAQNHNIDIQKKSNYMTNE